MSVGFPIDKATIDQRAGSLAWQLRETFVQVEIVKAWLDARQDSDLTALGYTTSDIEALRSSYTDMSNLGKIAHGQGTQANANDFFFWAGRLTGVQ